MENAKNTGNSAPNFTATGDKFPNTVNTAVIVKDPTIVTLTWSDAQGKKIDKAKYGKKTFLRIETKASYGLSAFVVVHCDDWKQDYVGITPITKCFVPPFMQSDNDPEEAVFSFTPKVEWLTNVKTDKLNDIIAKVYIIHNKFGMLTPKLEELKQIAEEFKKNELYRNFLTHCKGYIIRAEKTEKIPISKIIIVIDPGHGHKSGDTGTEAWKYSHAIKNEKGDIKKNDAGEVVTQTSTFKTIPDYVYSNENACKEWQAKLLGRDGACNGWSEREIVFEIAELMKPKLEEAGHVVYMTRTEKVIASGLDNLENLYSRNNFSNEKNADYFISIHVNGNDANSSIWKRGAFYMYRKNDEQETINISKQLGVSLVKYLKTYNKDKTDFIPIVTETFQQKDLAVLSSDKTKGNKAKYKSLVEIGTYTNPKDAAILLGNKDVIKVTVAEQLVKGLLEHITNHFL